MIAGMSSLFRRKNRDAQAEVARFEEELAADRIIKLDTIGELLDQYGRNAQEDRQMGSTLRKAVMLARDEMRWAEAVPLFRDERARQPDYDVPSMWLADFLEHEGRTHSAIALAKNAAMRCRRKSDLLEQAAEFALFAGEARESVHLFAQAITTVGRGPRSNELGLQRSFLFMAELFDVFGNAQGARWARQIQDATYLDEDYVHRIRSAANRATEKERNHIKGELPEIYKELKKRITKKN